ncbi:MAG: hypothetical protein AAFV53_22205 [Myxococcota bacterium]
MRVFLCEQCGAPVDAPWAELVITCGACGTQHFPGKPDAPIPPRIPVDERPRINLGGRTYVIEGQLARGDSSVVFRARWVVRLGELVVVKVLQALDDDDLMRREWETLHALRASTADGARHYVTRLPAPVAMGLIRTDRERRAAAYRWKSGFVHTLEQVGAQHRAGVDGRIVVWILKRLLEQLGWLHRAGFVHGAVVPAHVLVHPRDHGAILVGWTVATPWTHGRTRPLPAVPARWRGMYPGADRPQATPALDIAMACQCARAVGGWTEAVKEAISPQHAALKRVLDRGTSGKEDDAWALRDALVAASKEAYGPPAYTPLTMLGWR